MQIFIKYIVLLFIGNFALETSFELVPSRMGKILTEMSRKEIQVRAYNMRAQSNLVNRLEHIFAY